MSDTRHCKGGSFQRAQYISRLLSEPAWLHQIQTNEPGQSEHPHTHSRQSAEFAALGALHILSQLSAHRYAVTGPPAHKWKAARIFIPSLAVS